MIPDQKPPGLLTFLAYATLAAVAIGLFFLIRASGVDLTAPDPSPGQVLFASTGPAASFNTPLRVLLALAVIIFSARMLGAVFAKLGQPQVMGEVIAGILLGPSFLGYFAPSVATYILPSQVVPSLNVIAQIGVALFMFLVGIELNPAQLRRNPRVVVAVSNAGIMVPFLLGSLLALVLYPRFSTNDVPFPVFILFIGISMSVTAFPVLARILTDRGIQRSRLGSIALACAAVGDVTAWCLLAVVLGAAHATQNNALWTIGASIVFIAFMLLVARRGVDRIARREQTGDRLHEGTFALLLVALLLSAFAAEKIGIHALFGAFILGAVVPHDSVLARKLTERLRDVTVVFFLPVYFAFVGTRTQIGLLDGWSDWMMAFIIIGVASLGKFGGALAAARTTGLAWRESAALGILMNTRGLMELIVLNIGLDLHVLSPTLFAMFLIMAIVTTLATTPILDLLNRNGALFAEADEDRRVTAEG
jgi:Kef-type K+ transport system membrane component KefB